MISSNMISTLWEASRAKAHISPQTRYADTAPRNETLSVKKDTNIQMVKDSIPWLVEAVI